MRPATESVVYEFEQFRLDATKRLLWNGSGPVPLTPKVFETLLYLVRNPGKTITKDELISAVWPDTVVEENNLNKNISVLRQFLGEKPGEHHFIATVPGRGYRFVAPVVENPGDASKDAEPGVSDLEVSGPAAVRERTGRRQLSLSSWRFLAIAFLVLCVLATAFYLWRSRSRKPGPIRSIAVLPFRPIMKEVRNEALELGMADSLITQLGKSNDLAVRSLNTTRAFAESGKDPAEIGRNLGVDAIIDGTLQISGERVRVTTKLIRTSDGKQLWAENFDERMRDIFSLQDSISGRVAAVLNAKLGKRSRKHYTENVDSYQLFILGRYSSSKLTPQDHTKAIDYFQKAIAKDPNFALAYAGITDTYVRGMLASDIHPVETVSEAKAAAIRAVELDDELPEAHVALGVSAMFYDWNWPEAEKHLLRAYDLDPNDTEAELFLAHFYSNMGNHDKAIELGIRAQKLDPLTIRHALGGQFLYYAGRYDEAVDSLKQTIELNPNHWLPRMFIARVYIEQGKYRDAILECEHAKELGSPSLELLALEGVAYAKLGDVKMSREQLRELEEVSRRRYVPPYFSALIHNSLGETDVALSLLEKGFYMRDVRMTFLKVDPKWNNVRHQPRFIALMKQMRFE